MKKAAVYGGTFDPIHNGHLNLAQEVFEKTDLEEILFCPANISPRKINSPPFATAKDRLVMVHLALLEYDHFVSIDDEIKRGGVSYTIDTLEALKEKYKDQKEISLLIAQDSLAHFLSWKDSKKIIENFEVFVGCRTNFSFDNLPKELDKLRKNFITTKEMEISSTDIRKRFNKGLCVDHLLPPKVLDYIYKNRLY